MNTTSFQSSPATVNVGLALAARAWQELCRSAGRRARAPVDVISLKAQRLNSKSGVYRLARAADDGSDVVAKRCLRPTAQVERAVYERILPRLNLPALRYHGYFDEGHGDFCWLFFEDAGTEKVREPQRALPSAWIAQLHVQAAELTGEVALPERGSAHYLDHLRSARRMIDEVLAGLSNAHDDGDDDVIGTLRDLHVLLDRVEARWEAFCAPCATAPRTLVHGDFGPKNVRLRSAPCGTEVVVLDWETAGWGPIAVDIPQLPSRPSRKPDKSPRWRGVALDVYTTNTSGAWDGADKQRELARLAAVGTVFHYLSSIRWAAEQVHSGGTFKPMARLRLYTEEFMRVVAAMRC